MSCIFRQGFDCLRVKKRSRPWSRSLPGASGGIRVGAYAWALDVRMRPIRRRRKGMGRCMGDSICVLRVGCQWGLGEGWITAGWDVRYITV